MNKAVEELLEYREDLHSSSLSVVDQIERIGTFIEDNILPEIERLERRLEKADKVVDELQRIPNIRWGYLKQAVSEYEKERSE